MCSYVPPLAYMDDDVQIEAVAIGSRFGISHINLKKHGAPWIVSFVLCNNGLRAIPFGDGWGIFTRDEWNDIAAEVDRFYSNVSDEEIEGYNYFSAVESQRTMNSPSSHIPKKDKTRKEYFCPYCEKHYWDDETPMHKEHIIPRSRGGGDRKNIVECCKNCNMQKFTLTPWEWLGDDWLPPAGYETVFAYAYATRVDPLAIC